MPIDDFPSAEEVASRIRQAKEMLQNVEKTQGKPFATCVQLVFDGLQLNDMMAIMMRAHVAAGMPPEIADHMLDTMRSKVSMMMTTGTVALGIPATRLAEVTKMAAHVARCLNIPLGAR